MTRGGYREGAGRPKGSGKFGEPTKALRVPISSLDQVYAVLQKESYARPLYECRVAAGFPSPAEYDVERALDLNEHLIQHPAATFFVRVSGDSMIDAGIHEGDILVVDRSLEAISGKIVIAVLNGELTVKRLIKEGKKIFLRPENEAYPVLEIADEAEFSLWGVVTNVIHKV